MVANARALAPAPGSAWAQIEMDGLRSVRGDVVAFDQRTVVIALDHVSDVPIGRALWVVLGIEGEQAVRVAASVVQRYDDHDRLRIAVELADPGGAGRRRHPRVPFTERIEVIGITASAGPDPRWRGSIADLSMQGVGTVLTNEIRVGAVGLLRFVLPPHRSVFQVRAQVVNCERESADRFRAGFVFERMTAGHVQQLHAAVMHLARGA